MASSEDQNQSMRRNLLSLHFLKPDIEGLTIPTIEQSFYSYGIYIARRPTLFIILCLLASSISSIGLINFSIDKQSVRLWFSQDSVEHMQNLPINLRTHTVIYEADNVLLKKVLLEMLHIHKTVSNLATEDTNWESLCFRVPQINKKYNKSDRTYFCDPELSKGPCLEKSILQIWGYNRSLIESLSQKKILWDINNKKIIDSLSGYPMNFFELFGQIKLNKAGNIISAKSSMHTWVTTVDKEAISKGDYIIDIKTGFKIDNKTLAWEKEFMNTLNNYKSSLNITMYFQIASDMGLLINGIITSDILYLVYGIILVVFYATIKMGRFNLIHQKPWTSICGLTCVINAVLFSYGICSTIGIPYGTANHIIPILLLGICVNNMFIIAQSWNNLSYQEMQLILPERVGCMVRDSWLSITITFVVTLTVFLIGSLSTLPAISHFCLYAVIAVGALYLFQSTSFIACFTIDQIRLEDNRNGLLFCLKYENWKPSDWGQKEYFQTVLYHLCSKFFNKQSFKIIVLIATTLMATGSSVGVYNVQHDIQINWLLPKNSHVQQFLNKISSYYPSMGEDGHIVFSNKNFSDNLNKIESALNHLKNNKYVGEFQNSFDNIKRHPIHKGTNIVKLSHNDSFKNSMIYYSKSDKYVHKSPHINKLKRSIGTNNKSNILRSSDVNIINTTDCRSTNSTPLSISFKYRFLNTSQEKNSAMNEVSSIVENLNLTDGVHIWSTAHHNLRMNQVIGGELYQILGLTLLVTLVATLLLASWRTSLLITVCVLFTLVDVGCVILLCGLTVNVITSLSLLVGVCLSVDYCIHIAHTFMVYRGTQNERAHRTITYIGPAVIRGGISSLISIFFLMFAESYFFSTFFKIILATILLGLYHALVFLPVALSLIGPEPYEQTERGHPINNISTFTMANPKYLRTDEVDGIPRGNVLFQDIPISYIDEGENGIIAANVSLEDIPISYTSSPEISRREEQDLHNDLASFRGLRPVSHFNVNTI